MVFQNFSVCGAFYPHVRIFAFHVQCMGISNELCMNIIAISGSLRKDSYNTSLLRVCEKLAPEGMHIEIASINALPIYNEDDESSYPAVVQELKNKILAADGIIIATPEYNRSIPSALTNVLDWVSRPYGTNAFAGKPVLVAGVSGGKIGTALAQNHLRSILLYLDARVLGQPELYIGPAGDVFDQDGNITDEYTKDLLAKGLNILAKQITQ